MSIENKRITFSHLRAHRGHYEPSCSRRWCEERGLNWKHFCREGYTVGEMRSASLPHGHEGLERLIDFIEKEGLWSE